ncbi:MAG: WD40 repeat domain-containing protein [Cyanobacterium sp. T60_A2020_053]|nr:WD40 repeat domain-containing protein [Cyanobacterium sp. T60_A2020_053]
MTLDVPSLIRNNLASDFGGIPTDLRKFYSESTNDYKVKIYTDYFKKTIGDITVTQLHGILSPIPTAIFYTDINDYTCQFNVGFWDLKSIEPKIISSDLWNWKNTFNVLQQSEVNQEDCLIKIRELIITLNQLLASYFIDISFLKINPLYELKFPEFSQKLLAKHFEQKAVNAVYIDTLKQRQAEQITILDNFKSQIQQVNNAIVEGAGKWKMYKAWFTYSPVYSLAINSAESMIVSEKKGDLVFSKFDGNSIQPTKFTYNGHSLINGLKFFNRGKNVIYGHSFGHITAFDRDRNKDILLYRHYGKVNSIAIHPHENIIASGGDDRKVNIFNFDNRKIIGSHKMESAVLSVAFSPDGQLIAIATKDGCIHLGSLYSQEIVLKFQENHSVLCVRFTLDGKTLVTGDSNKNIVLWDVKTGSLIRNLKGHSSSINSLVFSKDGSTLFSASADKTIKLWNWKTGDCVRTLEGHVDSVTCLALSSDGHTLVSGSKDATIAVWRDIIA